MMTDPAAAGTPGADSPNFGDVAAGWAQAHPYRCAVTAAGRYITYGELDDRARRVATLLAKAGAGRGGTIALANGNIPAYPELLLGVLKAGCVVLPVNVKLGAGILAYIGEHSGVCVVFADREHQDQAAALCSTRRPRPDTIWIDEPGAGGYQSRLAAVPPQLTSARVAPDDPAILMYTSGSTGVPKGCLLSHANTLWQAWSSAATMMHTSADSGLVMGALYHANALWGVLYPMLHAGGRVAILPTFDPDDVLEAIESQQVTFLCGTPSMYTAILAAHRQRRTDLSSVTLVECGSAPVPPALLDRIRQEFHVEAVETYGLTEGGANILAPRWGVKKPGSTGLPVPGVEIRIVPASGGADCGPGEVGELWSRSPANAIGYLKEPQETSRRFTADGWLKTGDLMRRDAQGYCYFCGRVDDMISVGGENVYPKEVENLLLAHPAVADAGVVSIRHASKGQAPVAFVVLASGTSASEDDLKSHCISHGPAYAHPRRVFFLDRLPLSTTSKLDRAALSHLARELLPGGVGA